MLGLRLLEEFVHASDFLSARFRSRGNRPAHLELGRRGEEAAYFYLRRHGFTVVARDWRSGKAPGDLDLVAWENNVLCFIEVKTRTTREVATAESAVDESKRRTLRKIARHYLRHLPEPAGIRFDVVAIYFESDIPADFTLFKGVFGWSEKPGY